MKATTFFWEVIVSELFIMGTIILHGYGPLKTAL